MGFLISSWRIASLFVRGKVQDGSEEYEESANRRAVLSVLVLLSLLVFASLRIVDALRRTDMLQECAARGSVSCSSDVASFSVLQPRDDR